MHPSRFAKNFTGKFFLASLLILGLSLTTFLPSRNSKFAQAQAPSPQSGSGNIYLPMIVVGQSSASPQPTATPGPTATSTGGFQPVSADVSIAASTDDVEQRLSDGYMYMDSSDLELVNDPQVAGGPQSVGLRFTNLGIPQGAAITSAYIEFTVDETTSETTSLVLHGVAADNAAAFPPDAYYVTNLPRTQAQADWNNIPTWNTVGANQQSPDLSAIVQEIVDRPGWAEGNSLALIVEGSGRRVAKSYESGAASAARLHIEYTSGSPAPAPTATPHAPTATPVLSATPVPTTTPLPTITAPAPTPTAEQPNPVGQSGNWNLIFGDEFNGSSLDQSTWRTCFWWADTTCSIETNNELELYNPEDVLVENGMLRLRAQKRDMSAWNGNTYHYTSGMVMTGGRSGGAAPGFSFKYGYIEARVKVPAGKGLWPAFWMLPVSYNSRPEIDAMEILADAPNVYHMNYHYIGGDKGTSWTGPDFSAGWHVLGLDWEPNAIVWYVDGVERWRFTDASVISNEPEYLLLNLAVGGDWPGSPDANTPFPSTFDIDYVRTWQH